MDSGEGEQVGACVVEVFRGVGVAVGQHGDVSLTYERDRHLTPSCSASRITRRLDIPSR